MDLKSWFAAASDSPTALLDRLDAGITELRTIASLLGRIADAYDRLAPPRPAAVAEAVKSDDPAIRYVTSDDLDRILIAETKLFEVLGREPTADELSQALERDGVRLHDDPVR